MRCRITPLLIYTLLTIQLSGCMMGPDYVRPKLTVPAEFKELKGWKQAQPQDHVLRGKWWKMFNDPRLNRLEEQVATGNFSLAQAEAQYRQAEHLVLTAQSALFPVASASGTFNRFLAASGQSVAVPGVRNLFGLALSMSWQPDLWGSVRRQIEANTDTAQASAATMQALRLSLQATLAVDYYQLKMLDGQKALLDGTADAYNKILTITKNRYAVGVAAKSDVVQAEAQTESVRAQAINLGVQRAQYEHAIAVLIGKAPAEVAMPAEPLAVSPPSVPLQLPSELLERRPDIATAERKMAASNAQIGVAKAAYFPTLNLGATTGYQSTLLNTLLDSARRYWALGPAAVALSIFDGGAKNAQYKQAIDQYDANAAAYRQTVLTAFQQVEDNLAAVRILEEESQVQNKAVAAANQALELTLNQYKAGTVNYLNVMTAQTVALSNRITAVQLQGARLTAAVQLVTALGGGWDNSKVPSSKDMGKDIKWTDYLSIPLIDQGK
ncbi:efflux transporter outer membrane subunit [Methylovulum psychrotolerans]|uniref:efflux transporter outer membrane subunit n=1 Tax=Methylovulum psychrotolerans TaxID=1704499 RepID=UPI001BFF02F1|nr:efflux transporter outer membrane subunit [Methylovulum psychrotolerans]MBT9099773.1 efflux transporter outer membrane subunit [Methylovulum psychrotolerans]